MLSLRKCGFVTVLGASAAVVIAGSICFGFTRKESKTAQCQRLITLVNQGNSTIYQNQNVQPATTAELAQSLEAVSQNLAAIDLADPKLKEFQSQFVAVFQALSQATTKADQALNSAKTAEFTPVGREKVEKAKPEIEAAGKKAVATAAKADALAGEVNRYCSFG